MGRGNAGVWSGGDDGETTVGLDGGEQKRAGAGEAERYWRLTGLPVRLLVIRSVAWDS